MTTSTEPGASAWQRPPYYSVRTCGAHLAQTDDRDGRRQRYAAGAIQAELAIQGYLPRTAKHDGHYGQLTDVAIHDFQRHHGLVADGAVGPKTMRRLCWPVVLWDEYGFGIPDRLVLGTVRHESAFDPGAEGADRRLSTDRGLAQISDESFPDIGDDVAYGDIRDSIDFVASSLRAAHDTLQNWDAAVAHHNNQVKARAWARDGVAPDQQIADYVAAVRRDGALPL